MDSRNLVESGFVAGTLVHTDKGLVPIEQLKVGDMVLSKHESGEGEQAYKPVINIFRNEDEPVLQIAYSDVSKSMDHLNVKLLYLTAEHLIWVVEDVNGNAVNDWVRARDAAGSVILLASGVLAEVGSVMDVWPTDCDDIGYSNDCMEEFPGIVIDFSGGKIQSYHVEVYFSGVNNNFSDETIDFDESLDVVVRFLDYIEKGVPSTDIFRKSVYNIEVSDFHTYYVGTDAVWVHNEGNCQYREFNVPWDDNSQQKGIVLPPDLQGKPGGNGLHLQIIPVLPTSTNTPIAAKIAAQMPWISFSGSFCAKWLPKYTAGTFASIIPSVVPQITHTKSAA
ncbi:pretoxin HINT domain-containing protein [Fluviicoccus keumensis]|uniref:Pretoxin HINT domain-containing protein n=1 Tax=Fluviicoccus keumensis TaxID=1435465 RepID=A0A4Q7ZC87_9GAMM|nr:pretoxin HINT domain-containing protein [Fluviicoccus keumensis]